MTMLKMVSQHTRMASWALQILYQFEPNRFAPAFKNVDVADINS